MGRCRRFGGRRRTTTSSSSYITSARRTSRAAINTGPPINRGPPRALHPTSTSCITEPPTMRAPHTIMAPHIMGPPTMRKPSPVETPIPSSDIDTGKDTAPFVVAGAMAGVAGYYLTKSDDEWSDASSNDADDANKAATPPLAGSDQSDYDEVDAKPEGQIGPLWFKNIRVSSENKEKLSASLEKNTTLEWAAFHESDLTDAAVNSLCHFLEKNTALKTLIFDTAVFTASELSSILLALAEDVNMLQINISEPIGDDCVAQMVRYIGHSLPVLIRSVPPWKGETSRIEVSGRNGGGRMFIYMSTVKGIKSFKRYK